MKTRGIISSLYLAKALVARLLHYLFPSFWGGKQVICIRPFHHLVLGNNEINCCCYRSSGIAIRSFLADPTCFDLRRIEWQQNNLGCPMSCPVLLRGRKIAKNYFGQIVVDYGGMIGKFRHLQAEMRSQGVRNITMAMENACQLACPTCRKEHLQNSLSAEEIDRGWGYLHRHSSKVEHLSLGGSGEPLLVPQIRELLGGEITH